MYPNSSINNSCECNIMTLSGNGQVMAVPDIAVLRLGVQTNGDNLTAIQEENANLSQDILQALRQLGVTDIKTFEYSVNRLFDFVDGNRIDRGYTVRNIFEIRTSDLDQVGTLIDTAVSNGANVVDLISFEVSDSDNYYLLALNLAVMNAYQKAKSVADSLSIMLIPIPLRITENSMSPIPFRSFAFGEARATTPIEAGPLQIEAMVSVEFTY